jgi:hypothetical protein
MPLRANIVALVPNLDALVRDPSVAIGLPPTALAALQAQIAAAQGAIAAAMSYAPTQTAGLRAVEAAGDRTLDADQIAAELGQSRRWVFRNAGKLPFARRVSRKSLVGSEAGLRRWRESQKD